MNLNGLVESYVEMMAFKPCDEKGNPRSLPNWPISWETLKGELCLLDWFRLRRKSLMDQAICVKLIATRIWHNYAKRFWKPARKFVYKTRHITNCLSSIINSNADYKEPQSQTQKIKIILTLKAEGVIKIWGFLRNQSRKKNEQL